MGSRSTIAALCMGDARLHTVGAQEAHRLMGPSGAGLEYTGLRKTCPGGCAEGVSSAGQLIICIARTSI